MKNLECNNDQLKREFIAMSDRQKEVNNLQIEKVKYDKMNGELGTVLNFVIEKKSQYNLIIYKQISSIHLNLYDYDYTFFFQLVRVNSEQCDLLHIYLSKRNKVNNKINNKTKKI